MNLLSTIPASLPEEITETLVHTKSFRIERTVSHGHASPEGFWYDQDQIEFVLLIQGAARLRFEEKVIEMKASDWINIPRGPEAPRRVDDAGRKDDLVGAVL
jgi:cupin 2 domain-containing protein